MLDMLLNSTQALIIAFTSSFIQRLLFHLEHGTMDGFVEHSLAYFNVSDFPPGVGPSQDEIKDEFKNTTLCRLVGSISGYDS